MLTAGATGSPGTQCAGPRRGDLTAVKDFRKDLEVCLPSLVEHGRWHLEGRQVAGVAALAHTEVEPAVGQLVDQCGLLGDVEGIVKGEQHDCGADPDAAGLAQDERAIVSGAGQRP